MADATDLLRRADSLIKADAELSDGERHEQPQRMPRRRSFVASATATDRPDATARRPTASDDDLPVLTDVVLPAPRDPEEDAQGIAAGLRSTLAGDLADVIDRQLADQVPALLEATLVKATGELRLGLEATIRSALSDFLGQRGQLRLPLGEPGGDEPAAHDSQPAV